MKSLRPCEVESNSEWLMHEDRIELNSDWRDKQSCWDKVDVHL